MEGQVQSQKFKFKFPKFLQKKSSKSNKRASISGAYAGSGLNLTSENIIKGNVNDGIRKPFKKNSLKLKHAKSLDCLESMCDYQTTENTNDCADLSLKYEIGDTEHFGFGRDDNSVNSATACANEDFNGNNLTFPGHKASSSFVNQETKTASSNTNIGTSTPEKKTSIDDTVFHFEEFCGHHGSKNQILNLQSESMLSLPVHSTTAEIDESDNESIFSADIAWERENGGNETTDLPTESQYFKPPAAPVNRKNSRRLSLSVELPRFRKRKINKENDDDDNVSVQSLDVSSYSQKKKSKRSLLRVSASLANLISPSRGRNECEGFKVPSSPRQAPSPYRPPLPSPAKRRVQVTWLDSVSGSTSSIVPDLSNNDIKRQEAIYELYQGEKDMLEDLENVKKLYRDSLLTLGLMSQVDVDTLFGNLDALGPVHQDLSSKLLEQRRPDGTTDQIGSHINEWCKNLNVYVDYCANQIKAKAIFDEKKNQPAIDDFFQRCLASPWSRKLDLWTFLDGARGRFVKYPLLVRSIQKYTPSESEEALQLEKAIQQIEKIIKEADHRTGQAKCEHSKSSLHFLYDDQRIPEIQDSTSLLCSGCMKNNKSSKLYVFLFDKVVVMSRSTTQNGRQMYQVYRQPIPVVELLVEDLPDGEVKMGSFRNAFGTGNQTAKNLIRFSFMESDRGQSHTLMANDEHDKRQWMQALGKVTNNIVVVPETKGKDKQQLTS